MHRKRNIVIRVDASFQVGLGHFKRCLSIAQQLHILNYNPILVLNNDFNNTNYDSAQFEIIILNNDNEFIELVRRLNCKTILFDVLHYHTINNLSIFNNLLDRLKNHGFSLVGIGDYKPFKLMLDVQVNPYQIINLSGFFSGYEYIVISNSIKNKKQKNTKSKKRLLVSFGGSDINMATYNTLTILNKSKVIKDNWNVAVFIGEFFKKEHIYNINTLIKENMNFKTIEGGKLQTQMHKYQLGIVSGGLTKFELAYLGIPAIIISQQSEEKSRSIVYSKKGSAHYLCDYKELLDNPDNSCRVIEKIISDKKKMHAMSENGKKMIDGLGAKRIADLVIEVDNKL